nr:MAG TPA: Plasmid conjugative transfer protein PilI [Caudoviricetes sp.]
MLVAICCNQQFLFKLISTKNVHSTWKFFLSLS